MRTRNLLAKELQNEISALPLLHQRKILDMVRLMKKGDRTAQKKRDILELKGCGKEIWSGIDAQQYVNKLREEWE